MFNHKRKQKKHPRKYTYIQSHVHVHVQTDQCALRLVAPVPYVGPERRYISSPIRPPSPNRPMPPAQSSRTHLVGRGWQSRHATTKSCHATIPSATSPVATDLSPGCLPWWAWNGLIQADSAHSSQEVQLQYLWHVRPKRGGGRNKQTGDGASNKHRKLLKIFLQK